MIDWFTVVAQVINFLILVGLLKYFLYGRIMNAIENRDKEIVAQRDQAEQYIEKSKAELELAKETNRRLDQQKDELLAAVGADVEVFRKQQIEKVRVEIDGTQTRWADSIREEQDAFLLELSKRTSDSVCSIARQALNDLAGVTLENQIVSRFLDSVRSLGAKERQLLIHALASVNQIAVVQTTHELTNDLKSSLVTDLEQELQIKLDVRFETIDDLECGIAFQTNSHKLGWNLRDYMIELENDLRTMIEEEAIDSPNHTNNSAVE